MSEDAKTGPLTEDAVKQLAWMLSDIPDFVAFARTSLRDAVGLVDLAMEQERLEEARANLKAAQERAGLILTVVETRLEMVHGVKPK